MKMKKDIEDSCLVDHGGHRVGVFKLLLMPLNKVAEMMKDLFGEIASAGGDAADRCHHGGHDQDRW